MRVGPASYQLMGGLEVHQSAESWFDNKSIPTARGSERGYRLTAKVKSARQAALDFHAEPLQMKGLGGEGIAVLRVQGGDWDRRNLQPMWAGDESEEVRERRRELREQF